MKQYLKYRPLVLLALFTLGLSVGCGSSKPDGPPKSVLDNAVGVGATYNDLDQPVQSLLPPGATEVNYLGNGYYEFKWTAPHNIQGWYIAVMSNAGSHYPVVSITKE